MDCPFRHRLLVKSADIVETLYFLLHVDAIRELLEALPCQIQKQGYLVPCRHPQRDGCELRATSRLVGLRPESCSLRFLIRLTICTSFTIAYTVKDVKVC